MQKTFIGIAGNMGTGKSTLTQMMAELLEGWAHFESVADNPYLEDFYRDMPKWSFHLQVYFLVHRFKAHRKIQNLPGIHIQDRTIYEDANIFAPTLHESGHFDDRDYANYLALYDSMTSSLKQPDLMVYVKKSVPRLLEQIRLRNRECEKDVSVGYLENLNSNYDKWVGNYDGKKLIIESDELDFVKHPEHFEHISNLIKEALR